MTKYDVIRLATEAGLCTTSNGFVDWVDAGPCLHEMAEFAKLVAEHEREACAQIGDGFHDDEANCGDLIRARGQE